MSQLYESLKRQTCSDFEWVVVDDGSSDNTEALLSQWEKEGSIAIVWRRQPNQGKHIAINSGVSVAQGELFFIVDSDDYLTDDAVERVKAFWNQEERGTDISGIIGYRTFIGNRLVGTPLPANVKCCKLRDTGRLYHSVGDKVVIYRTSIMKRFPFPKFGNERFLGESYVFNQIDDLYDMVVMNDRVYMFQYQKDGLSQDFRKLYRNNPRGFLASAIQSLRYATSQREQIKTKAHIQCLSIKTADWKSWVRSVSSFNGVLAVLPALYLYHKIFIRKVCDVKPFEESSEN